MDSPILVRVAESILQMQSRYSKSEPSVRPRPAQSFAASEKLIERVGPPALIAAQRPRDDELSVDTLTVAAWSSIRGGSRVKPSLTRILHYARADYFQSWYFRAKIGGV